MTDRELMQQWMRPGAIVPVDINTVRILITALREQREQPEQEPVAWRYDLKRGGSFAGVFTEYSPVKLSIGENWTPLYTTPPRQWVGLTDEVDELAREMVKGDKSVNWLARAIEAKLREKNGGEA